MADAKGNPVILVLKPVPGRQVDFYVIAAIVAFCLAVIFSSRLTGGKIAGYVAFAIIMVGAETLELVRVRVRLSANDLSSTDLVGPSVSVNRSQIAAIWVFSYWITLVDSKGHRLHRLRPYWTRRQLRALATALKVPIVDKRRRKRF